MCVFSAISRRLFMRRRCGGGWAYLVSALARVPAAGNTTLIKNLEHCSQTPLLGGTPFGSAGPYLRIAGVARGLIDPAAAGNRAIPGIDAAVRTPDGRVEYRVPFEILRPADAGRGNGTLLCEATNRGKKLLFPYLFDAHVQGNTFDTLEPLGSAAPLHDGFTLAWCGWDATASPAAGGLALDGPLALEAGRPVVRVVRDEFVSGTRHGVLERLRLSYPCASLAPGDTRVTVREHADSAPRVLDASEWRFVDARHIVLLPEGTSPRPGWLYDVHYPATDARVLGVGYAVTRDFVSFLRHGPAAAGLLAGPVRHVLGVGISQAGRYLRGFLAKGFNRDEEGRRVMDGMLVHISGAGRAFVDDLFAQPFRTRTRHQDHGFPEQEFPFSASPATDPHSGRRAALLDGDVCDPLLIETNTSSEYWQKGASLLHTDPLAEHDLALPPNVRAYLIAGTQHDGRPGLATDRGSCMNPCNPHDPSPVLRALFQALHEWVRDGRSPPDSRIPCLSTGTLQQALALAFPRWEGIAPPPACNDVVPPGDWVHRATPSFRYEARVCAIDSDGNEIDGVLTPDIRVPLGTYTGWNRYRPPYPEGVLADRRGSFVGFAITAQERRLHGDPRPSLQERYGSRQAYLARVRHAAEQLVAQRLLLPADAQLYIGRAEASSPRW
jgi:hypothetical protein